MRTRWSQFVVLFLVMAALVVAPCVHCRPVAADSSQQTQAGHDCCPRQSQPSDDETGCSWLPALSAPSDGKVLKVDLQTIALAVEPVPQALQPVAAVFPALATAEPLPSSTPPLYVSHSAFLI
jgi:hypothetical protein